MIRIALKFACVLSAGLFAGQVAAYSTKTCLGERLKWGSNSKQLRASTTSFPAGTWRNTLQGTIDRFNLNPSRFTYSLGTTSSVRRGNGTSEVWGSTDTGLLAGAPARAFQYWTCYWFFGNHVSLDEVDVVFDYRSPWQWASSEAKGNVTGYGGGTDGRPMRSTGLHEIGHGLILNHENRWYNIMGTDFTHLHANGGMARAYFGADGSAAAVFLYGARSPARRDLGVVHWRYDGTSGEYSRHRKTRLFNTSGAVLASFDDAGETRFRVNRGQQVRAEFTYENMGSQAQNNVPVGFYISSNDLVTTADRRIGGGSLSISAGGHFTAEVTLTIPANLDANRNYWLGVIVDENDAIAEVVEWNNATYLPIRTN